MGQPFLSEGAVVDHDLQRGGADNGREHRLRGRQADDGLGDALQLRVVAVGQRDDGRAAGVDLLGGGEHAVVGLVAGHDGDDGGLGAEEREGAVLELAGRVALGVQVGDLFELPGPLQRSGVVDALADDEGVLRRGEPRAEPLQLRRHGEDLLDGFRQAAQARDELAAAAIGGREELEAEKVEADDLREVGLGGGDADLPAGPQVVGCVGHAGDAALRLVGEGEGEVASPPRVPAGVDGVRRLARLGDEDAPGAGAPPLGAHHLGGREGLHAGVGQGGDEVGADHGGVGGGAAAEEEELLRQGAAAELQVEVDVAVGGDAAGEGVAQDAGLLVDLLEEEVLVAALVDVLGAPIHVMDAPVDELSAVVNLDVVGGDRRDVAVLEVDEPVGVLEDGGDVGADHVLAVAEADDDGAAAAGGDDGVLALEEDGDGVGALDAGEGLGDAVDGAAGLLEEVGEDLGVGLGAEAVASATELLSQGVVVLDAAVVDDGDAAGAVEVGVRVELGGSADGGPAGVADADGAGDVGGVDGAEVLDEADGLGDADAALPSRMATPQES